MKKLLKITGLVIVVVVVLVAIFGTDDQDSATQRPTDEAVESEGAVGEKLVESESEQTEQPPIVGDTLSLRRFDITLNNAWVDTKTDTGNEFLDADAGDGNLFVIVDATWENTDSQSRMPFAGDLVFAIGEDYYTVDTTESVMADGWGMFFETLSPLERHTTKLVYKIPAREGMVAWWDVGADQSFYLGDIPIE